MLLLNVSTNSSTSFSAAPREFTAGFTFDRNGLLKRGKLRSLAKPTERLNHAESTGTLSASAISPGARLAVAA